MQHLHQEQFYTDCRLVSKTKYLYQMHYTRVIKIYKGFKHLKRIFNCKRMNIMRHVLTFRIKTPFLMHVFNVNGFGENVN